MTHQLTSTPEIKAIETRAFGCRFRSRLEARWATFFNALGIEWEYEKEGFKLPSGPYLPDFYIPSQPKTALLTYWLEVKPVRENHYKLFELGDMLGWCSATYAVLIGNIPDPSVLESSRFYGVNDGQFYAEIPGDQPYLWCACQCGQCVGLQFMGMGERIPCPQCYEKPYPPGYKGYSYDHPSLLTACKAARSARFEHGENGTSR